MGGAGGWLEEAGEDFDKGGFACAVWAKDGADVAGRDFERDVGEGWQRGVIFGDAVAGDHLGFSVAWGFRCRTYGHSFFGHRSWKFIFN